MNIDMALLKDLGLPATVAIAFMGLAYKMFVQFMAQAQEDASFVRKELTELVKENTASSLKTAHAISSLDATLQHWGATRPCIAQGHDIASRRGEAFDLTRRNMHGEPPSED